MNGIKAGRMVINAFSATTKSIRPNRTFAIQSRNIHSQIAAHQHITRSALANTVSQIATGLINSSAISRSAIPAQGRRLYSTSGNDSPVSYSISSLSEDEYHTVSDKAMESMVEYFEDLGDDHDIPGYDVAFESGVMTLALGSKGTYVVNKQPPNKQLWLSSPTSGPKRYDYDQKDGVWFYHRDHHLLKSLLDSEISEALGLEISVPI